MVRLSVISGVENIKVAIRPHRDHLLNIGFSKVVLQLIEYGFSNQKGYLFTVNFSLLMSF